ncbi:MAG: hypothetical protein ACLTBR_03235 [Anaerostipes sp.]|uniref:hypothetical protein n=1 Tax=Anaerostipes sp. TaxID=1872530 RepID=UPI0039959D22
MDAVELLNKEIRRLEGSLRRSKTKTNVTTKEVSDLKEKIKLKKFILNIVEKHVMGISLQSENC